MASEFDFLDLVLGASLVVQAVMLLLVLASVYSWVIILDKSGRLRRAMQAADRFEKSFWAGGDLGLIYKRVTARGKTLTGMETIFDAGFKEFARMNAPTDKPIVGQSTLVLQGVQRAMRVARMKEMEKAERNLATLATIGSTSPYVGLFGTVWGIMNAFMSLGAMKQATIATVAPGIAEALIATALGLFAAIPAVIAYNRFADKVDRLERRFEAFTDEFAALLQRHIHFRPAEKAA
ncbi:MAG: protein TolQ [Gammaproteobacteria bacterium]|nr:protein TolQ [Gammaproteobacteria bacterium]